MLNGTDSVLARDGDALVDLVRKGQGVLNIVSLGQVVDELDASIHELAPEGDAGEASTGRARRVGSG